MLCVAFGDVFWFSGLAVAVVWLNKSAPVCANLAACPLCVSARGPAADFFHSRFLPVSPLV